MPEENVLQLEDGDVRKFIAAKAHLGASNSNHQMQQYIFKKKRDGTNIINIQKTWEKLVLAARVIVAIEKPQDVCAISGKQVGQRAVLKFAHYTGCTSIAGRYVPGTFTNQIQTAFKEPRLLIICDPRTDQQPIREACYVNIPVIAFCDSDAPVKYVDIVIPGNMNSPHSVGLLWWLLAREVLRMRGAISRNKPWDIMTDLFFYRDPEEAKKEELALEEKKAAAATMAARPMDQMGYEQGAADVEWSGGNEMPVAAGFDAAAQSQVDPNWTGPQQTGGFAQQGGAGGDWNSGGDW